MKIEKLRYGHPDDKEKVSYYGELVWNIMRCMETMNTIIDHLNIEQPSQEKKYPDFCGTCTKFGIRIIPSNYTEQPAPPSHDKGLDFEDVINKEIMRFAHVLDLSSPEVTDMTKLINKAILSHLKGGR